MAGTDNITTAGCREDSGSWRYDGRASSSRSPISPSCGCGLGGGSCGCGEPAFSSWFPHIQVRLRLRRRILRIRRTWFFISISSHQLWLRLRRRILRIRRTCFFISNLLSAPAAVAAQAADLADTAAAVLHLESPLSPRSGRGSGGGFCGCDECGSSSRSPLSPSSECGSGGGSCGYDGRDSSSGISSQLQVRLRLRRRILRIRRT